MMIRKSLDLINYPLLRSVTIEKGALVRHPFLQLPN